MSAKQLSEGTVILPFMNITHLGEVKLSDHHHDGGGKGSQLNPQYKVFILVLLRISTAANNEQVKESAIVLAMYFVRKTQFRRNTTPVPPCYF